MRGLPLKTMAQTARRLEETRAGDPVCVNCEQPPWDHEWWCPTRFDRPRSAP